MVYLADKAGSLQAAREMLEKAIQNGSALEKFKVYSNFEDVTEVKEKLLENIKIFSKKVEPPILIYEAITI